MARRPRAVYVWRRLAAAAVVAAVGLLVLAITGGLSGGGHPAAAPARSGAATRVPPHSPTESSRRPAPGARAAARPSRDRSPSLPVDELAGQRIIYAYSGLTPPASLLQAIRAGEAAGVLLFGDNVSTVSALRTAMQQLQRAAADSPVHAPLLILTDQEGGEVRRLPGDPSLSERAIGASADALSQAAAAGSGAGRTLAAGGVNVNLSPVLDVMRGPGGFIDEYARSYGEDAGLVGRLGSAFITAQQRLGVLATAKHFPGLGAAGRGQDTDSRPVTLAASRSQLRDVDEAPFRSAIAAGVKLIMTSWAIYPALDPAWPAGLSARVLQGELRGRLRFAGVTITDTLSAGALTRFGSLPARALLAARAGADLIICSAINGSDDPSDGLSVLHALVVALARGQLSRSAAQASAARVLALRRSLRR